MTIRADAVCVLHPSHDITTEMRVMNYKFPVYDIEIMYL